MLRGGIILFRISYQIHAGRHGKAFYRCPQSVCPLLCSGRRPVHGCPDPPGQRIVGSPAMVILQPHPMQEGLTDRPCGYMRSGHPSDCLCANIEQVSNLGNRAQLHISHPFHFDFLGRCEGRGPTADPATLASCDQTLFCPLNNPLAFKLGNRSKNVKHQPPRRAGRIDVLPQRSEPAWIRSTISIRSFRLRASRSYFVTTTTFPIRSSFNSQSSSGRFR